MLVRAIHTSDTYIGEKKDRLGRKGCAGTVLCCFADLCRDHQVWSLMPSPCPWQSRGILPLRLCRACSLVQENQESRHDFAIPTLATLAVAYRWPLPQTVHGRHQSWLLSKLTDPWYQHIYPGCHSLNKVISQSASSTTSTLPYSASTDMLITCGVCLRAKNSEYK